MTALGDVSHRPEKRVLLECPSLAIDVRFFHSFLVNYLRWIPTRFGDWDEFPSDHIVLDASATNSALAILDGLTRTFSVAPESVRLPGPRETSANPPKWLWISHPRHEILGLFQSLADLFRRLEREECYIFIAPWYD